MSIQFPYMLISRFVPFSMMIVLISLLSCNGGSGSDATVIDGELTNCFTDSIRVYKVNGARSSQIAAAKFNSENGKTTFHLETKLPSEGFYLIGDDPQRSVTALLANGGTLKLTGNCQNAANTYKIEGSELNDRYQAMIRKIIDHNQKVNMLYQNLQIFSQTDPTQVQRVQTDLNNENTIYSAWLDSLTSQEGSIGKIATVYNFKPFMSDPSHSKYPNDREYFKEEFFAGIDLKDPFIGNLPQIYEKSRMYSMNLLAAGFPENVAAEKFNQLIAKTDKGSIAHENVLRGILGGLEQMNSELYITYGNEYVGAFTEDQKFSNNVKAIVDKMSKFAVGAEAPEIELADPDGKMLKLSSLRGNYVMIDFWASWCKPCRMENPNVVKAYQKYHSKGFEILGVSLDNDKGKWLAAIEMDGLKWKHVSDLMGWQSRGAAAYGVTSIPAAFLLDEEGKIAGKNLRGPALEQKLSEIYGF